MQGNGYGRSLDGAARIGGVVLLAACVGAAMPAAPARAQLLNQLQNAIGAGGGGAAGALGGLPAVSQASPLNLAGVLQYCVQNSLLGGGGASSVQSGLLGRLGGAGGTSNPQYTQGANGLLQTGQGQGFNLAGEGIVGELKQKVCELVLQQAKSLL